MGHTPHRRFESVTSEAGPSVTSYWGVVEKVGGSSVTLILGVKISASPSFTLLLGVELKELGKMQKIVSCAKIWCLHLSLSFIFKIGKKLVPTHETEIFVHIYMIRQIKECGVRSMVSFGKSPTDGVENVGGHLVNPVLRSGSFGHLSLRVGLKCRVVIL